MANKEECIYLYTHCMIPFVKHSRSWKLIYSDRRQIHTSLGLGRIQRGMRELLRMMETFVILTMLIASWVYTCLTHPSVLFNCVQLTVSLTSQERCLKMGRGKWKERFQWALCYYLFIKTVMWGLWFPCITWNLWNLESVAADCCIKCLGRGCLNLNGVFLPYNSA